MSGNWLETAGSWLSTPFRAILTPWWQRLIESKAESAAVNVKVVEAIVRFRILDCQRKLKMDPHKAEGIAQQVIQRVRPLVENGKTSPSSPDILKQIECEIELRVLPLTLWVQLACLSSAGTFNPHNAIAVNFTDEHGSQSHGSSMIASLQGSLPFTPMLAVSSFDQARLSPEAIKVLATFCDRNSLPEATFEIADQVALPLAFDASLANPRTLPRAWKPTQ